MDKYTILIILNLPFVLFGLLKAYTMYRAGILSRFSLLLRICFWAGTGLCIIFSKFIYSFLQGHNLTDSPALSLADVLLVTGVNFSLFLCLRLYSKLEQTERRVTELQEKLSIKLSNPAAKRPKREQDDMIDVI